MQAGVNGCLGAGVRIHNALAYKVIRREGQRFNRPLWEPRKAIQTQRNTAAGPSGTAWCWAIWASDTGPFKATSNGCAWTWRRTSARRHGELTPVHYAEVNLAARYETTALIAQRLVVADPELPAAEVLSLLKTVCWATLERNRAIERLGLSGKGQAAGSLWDALDAAQAQARPAARRRRLGAWRARNDTRANPELRGRPDGVFRRYAAAPEGPRFGDVWTAEQRDFLIVAGPAPVGDSPTASTTPAWNLAGGRQGFGERYPRGVVHRLAVGVFALGGADTGGGRRSRAGRGSEAGNSGLACRESRLAERIDVQRWRIVNQATGGECEILTTDSTGSHGARPNMILLNEVSHISNESFAQTVADNFAKMPDAFGLLCTNAGFLQSWAWKWREIYRVDDRWHFIKVTATPPWQSAADIDEARKRSRRPGFGGCIRASGLRPGAILCRWTQSSGASSTPGRNGSGSIFSDTICAIGVDAGLTTHHAAVVVLTGRPRGREIAGRASGLPGPAVPAGANQR